MAASPFRNQACEVLFKLGRDARKLTCVRIDVAQQRARWLVLVNNRILPSVGGTIRRRRFFSRIADHLSAPANLWHKPDVAN